MTRPDMSSVGLTAHFTAYAWHLLDVPEAHRFVTGRGRLLHLATSPLRRLAPVLGFADPLDTLLTSRHLLLEHVLRQEGGRTFVELASGLSPRGTAYCADPDVVFVEVDLPDMSALKRRLVADARGVGQRFVAGDVTDPALYADLAEHVRDRGPVTVVTEGLNSYLPREGLEALVRNVADFLRVCGGGRFVLDINPADALSRYGLFGRLVVGAIQTVARFPVTMPVRSGTDGVLLLEAAGFTRIRLHDPRSHPACAGHDFSDTRGTVLVLEGRIE
jgi:hypothetical protein